MSHIECHMGESPGVADFAAEQVQHGIAGGPPRAVSQRWRGSQLVSDRVASIRECHAVAQQLLTYMQESEVGHWVSN